MANFPFSNTRPGPRSFSEIARIIPPRYLQLVGSNSTAVANSYPTLFFNVNNSYTFDSSVCILGVTLRTTYLFAAGIADASMASAVAKNPGTEITLPDVSAQAATATEILAFNFFSHSSTTTTIDNFSEKTSVGFDLPFLPVYSQGERIGIASNKSLVGSAASVSVANVWFVFQRDLENAIIGQ